MVLVDPCGLGVFDCLLMVYCLIVLCGQILFLQVYYLQYKYPSYACSISALLMGAYTASNKHSVKI